MKPQLSIDDISPYFGISINRASAESGIPKSTLYDTAKRLGVIHKYPARCITEAALRECVGLTKIQTSEKLGFTPSAIYIAIKKFGLSHLFPNEKHPGEKVSEGNDNPFFTRKEVSCYTCHKPMMRNVSNDVRNPRFICQDCKDKVHDELFLEA